MHSTKPLEEIGMTPKEVDVYLALIDLKSASISDIMNRAKTSRKSIYEILQKLLDKGLASYTIKNGKKQFNAAPPERLVDVIKEKEESIRAILPELLEKYTETKEEMYVEVFIGTEGIKTATNNILKVGKPMYAVSGNGEMYDYLKYYTPQFIRQRTELGIMRKAVYNESARKKNLKPPLTEIRYITETYSSPIQFTVYGEHVNLQIYSAVPLAIHIKNKDIARAFMNYFRLMWAMGKK